MLGKLVLMVMAMVKMEMARFILMVITTHRSKMFYTSCSCYDLRAKMSLIMVFVACISVMVLIKKNSTNGDGNNESDIVIMGVVNR